MKYCISSRRTGSLSLEIMSFDVWVDLLVLFCVVLVGWLDFFLLFPGISIRNLELLKVKHT